MQLWMPYFASTTAIVLSIVVAAWLHNKHINTLNLRIDETNAGSTISGRKHLPGTGPPHGRLEERITPIVRG